MAAKTKEQIITVLYMVIIAMVFTAMVAGVHETMKDGIEVNRQRKEIRGIFAVLGLEAGELATPADIQTAWDAHIQKNTRDEQTYYTGLTTEGTVIALVFPIDGPGFWGPIGGYLAVNRDGTIRDIIFTQHTETPGLGARITEDWFREQFRGKSIYAAEKDQPPITLVTAGNPKGPNDVDAITGATGTSRAVQAILTKELPFVRTSIKAEEKE